MRASRADTRRAVVAGALALTACRPRAAASPAALPPLRALAPFPVGTCVQASRLDDPAFAALVAREVSQLTAEWEMKMEYIVRPDGSLGFDAPDRIADFARAHSQRLFGHTLVWYAQAPPAFAGLGGDRRAFRARLEGYVDAVVGRYRGLASGWDVVNEAVAEDGSGLRDSLWSQALGPLDHMVLAFHAARRADPAAPLFLNDYNLETLPRKRATFLRLAETLLKAGAPLSGLGTQTHVAADLPPGALKAAIADLGRLGLPVHVSEMDVSLSRARGLGRQARTDGQARIYAEAAEAFSALPPAQRFAFTHWGLRDPDSWLGREDPEDKPLLFDIGGRPKPAAAAWAGGLRG